MDRNSFNSHVSPFKYARTRPESTRFGVFSTKPISFVRGPQRYSAMKGDMLHLSTQYKTQGARGYVDSHSVQATATACALPGIAMPPPLPR